MLSPAPVLLDTHAWIWLVLGEKKLIHKTVLFVEEALNKQSVYLSDISLWEVSMSAKKGRITLGQPTLSWIKNAIKLSGVHLVRLTPEINVESTELPGEFHGDPADRLLIATARILNLTLITRDEKILEYGETKRVNTLKI